MSRKVNIVLIILNCISFVLGLSILFCFGKDYDFLARIVAVLILISSTTGLGRALKELIKSKDE